MNLNTINILALVGKANKVSWVFAKHLFVNSNRNDLDLDTCFEGANVGRFFVSKNIGYEFVFKASCVASSKSQVVCWWMWWCHTLMKGLYCNIFEFTIVCYRCMHTQFWMLMTSVFFSPLCIGILESTKVGQRMNLESWGSIFF